MLNVARRSCVRTFLLCLVAIVAAPNIEAQESQHPGLTRQLDRIDVAISAVGLLNGDASGTAIVNAKPTTVKLTTGNTVGALFTLRYTVKPYVGFEFNYGYGRYTDTFTPFGAQPFGGVQQNTAEYTAGYVAHLPAIIGIHPFASAGLGTLAFRPTPRGGEGLIKQARAAYYYTIGAEQTVLSPHFGIRLQVRKGIYKAPDFETNYLTIQKHTTTLEPGIGFFLRF